MRAFALVAAALAASAQAALTITAPSSSHWWIAESVNNIEWNCGNGNPSSYTVMITNSDVKVLTSPLAIVGVLNDFICSFSYTPGTELRAAPGYTLSLTNPLNNTQIYASSEVFEIKPKGSTYPPQGSPTAGSGSGSGGSGAGASGSGAASPSGSAASSTSTPNSAARNGASAVLALAGLAIGLTVA
jgi:hypothetical protein